MITKIQQNTQDSEIRLSVERMVNEKISRENVKELKKIKKKYKQIMEYRVRLSTDLAWIIVIRVRREETERLFLNHLDEPPT